MYKEFIVLDVETTGVDSKRDDIIEFAGVKINHLGEVVDRLEMFLATDQPVVPIVTALTGIREEDLKSAPKMDAVRDQIIDFIGDLPIVGHNIGFDIEFLNAAGCGLTNPALDTLELAYTVLPAQSYYSLEYLARHFNFPNQPSHRAMNDVLATVDLFKLLNHQIAGWNQTTRDAVQEVVAIDSWAWAWLVAQPISFIETEFVEGDDRVSAAQALVKELNHAQDHIDQLHQIAAQPINLLESHFAVNPLSLALGLAAKRTPAILLVDHYELWKLDWEQVAADLQVSLAVAPNLTSGYREDSELELAKSDKPLSSLEARLVTKVIVWRREWGSQPAKLHLPLEERYQWEQKFSTTTPMPAADIVVTTPFALLDAGDMQGRNLITPHSLLLEDAAIGSDSRTFSIPYLSAAISSRRDFVHQYVRPDDVKLADELFKLLHSTSTAFTKLGTQLIELYRQNPPSNQFERHIELNERLLAGEITELLQAAAAPLQEFIDKLEAAPNTAVQIDRTQKLVHHLQALISQAADYRYFLSADENRFFLELVPQRPDFSKLHATINSSSGLTIVSPGLAVVNRFDYFNDMLPEFNSEILAADDKTDLLLVSDASSQLTETTRQLLERGGKNLILAKSAHEAKVLFSDVFTQAQADHTVESNDTVGNALNVTNLAQSHDNFLLIGHYYWLRQLRWQQDGFDRTILGEMPFDPFSRPRFKIFDYLPNSFENYTLARAIMRLKETLHLAKLQNSRLLLVDSRLTAKDYGQKVLSSLNAFTVVPSGLDEALD